MNSLAEIEEIFYPQLKHETPFLIKISEILRTGERSKNLMVVLYLIEKDQFLFCSDSFRNIVGNDSVRMIREGWDLWFSIIDEGESSGIRDSLTSFFTVPYIFKPLSLRYHITDFYGTKRCLQHEIRIYKLEKCALAANYLIDISDKERIEHCFARNPDISQINVLKKGTCCISSREKEVLQLIGEGYSSKQIADILYISNHTAISHRKNLIEKFQVKNTAQLIKKASKVMEL